MDVLLVNFTLKDIKLGLFNSQGWGLAIKKQLRKNEMYKKLHLKELEMAKPTSARVIFCGFPYAGKTTLRKAVVRSIEHRSTISKSILNPCKDFMMKKIDGGQRLIQGGKQLTHRTLEVHSLKSSEGIRWSIWDMGGQEEFHGFHYFMLPDLSDTGNPSLFLLVCSPYVLRDEGFPSKKEVKLPIQIQNELEYWL
jgi:GTPase SAR1 family protein